MLALTKVKMSDSEKKMNKNTYDICHTKRIISKFLEVSRCSRAKQLQRSVHKKVCFFVQSCFFTNETNCCFFHPSLFLHCLSFQDYILCLSKL